MNAANAFLVKITPGGSIFRITSVFNRKFSNSLPDDVIRQNNIFNIEQKRQRSLVGRIEKIQVEYEGLPEKTTLVMNKNISTPYDCARHLGQWIADKSAVALLNNSSLWHMHKPLPDSCTLQLLNYKIAQPFQVNKAFWRTCSFLLGAVAKSAFKDQFEVQLHSFPSPNVRSGSFVYDVQLDLEDWKPTTNELKVLSMEMIKFCQQGHHIECMDVSTDVALDLFKNCTHKLQQIPDIAAHNNEKVTLFRAGHHVDISKGPMVTNTNHLGRITVANVLKLNTDIAGGAIYRFQGVALPSSILLNHFAFGTLEWRARQLNPARIPGSQKNFEEDHSFVAPVPV